MTRGEDPSSSRPGSAARERLRPPSRRLNLASRVRNSVRETVDRILGADLVWSAAFTLAVVALLSSRSCGEPYERFEVGQLAPYDIEIRETFDVVDQEETERKRKEAQDAAPDVYVYDTGRSARSTGQLADIFTEGRRRLERAFLEQQDPGAAVRDLLEGRAPNAARDLLVARRFDTDLEREMKAVLDFVASRSIVTSKAALERLASITLLHVPGTRRQSISDFAGFLDLDEARLLLRETLAGRLQLPVPEERLIVDFAATFVDANVTLDPVATHRERQEAAASVRPVVRRVAQGEILARKGERLTPATLSTIEAARASSGGARGIQGLAGLLFLSCMFAFFLYRYTRYHQRAFRKLRHLHALVVLILLSMLALASGMLWLAREIVNNLQPPFDDLDRYTYLIPLGAGAILVALLANGRIATVYSAFTALLFGAANGWDPHLMIWAMLVQCAGVYAISTYRERAALLRAGLVVGGVGAVSALALETLKGDLEPLAGSLYGAALAFVGGAVGVGLLISFALPMLERLFNVLTDIRLLELSNVNNPLLSEFALKAPGSYNHSLVVGSLAEEAARAIGANALFCRVAAFYHDIGKMNKAEYYVENQRGTNPHDRLSPSMSALIIASHVKDGIKMAREAGLPEQIVDIIPQHHGTKLMRYFDEKARTSADPSLGPVKKEDFRYPGPRPSTREAAIFMLADSVEAAARTVEEPTPHRLQDMIRKVTDSVVVDRELDQCDLTFADLDRIRDAFLRSLVSMYHHRVDYPGFEFGKRSEARPTGRSEPRAEAGEAGERRAVRRS
jgi:putative nucleotidyltransferase with HDIG domain